MIVDSLLSWVFDAFSWLVGLLPDFDIDFGGIASAWSTLGALNYFLPIAETVAVVIAAIALGPAFLLWTVTAWVAIGVFRGGSPTV